MSNIIFGQKNEPVIVNGNFAAGTTAGNIKAASEPTNSVPGDARGAGSVDLQQFRESADQIAIGGSSVICGGRKNQARGALSFVGAGESNTAFNGGNVCVGGVNNFAFGGYSIIVGGLNNRTENSSAFVGGGEANTANGIYSLVVGGLSNLTVGFYSAILGGFRGKTYRLGQQSHAMGGFSNAVGSAQRSDTILRLITTDDTPTLLKINEGEQELQILAGQSISFLLHVIGSKNDGSGSASFIRKGLIKNITGTTQLVGIIENIGTDIKSNLLLDISITANDTTDTLDIAITGIIDETWKWVGHLASIELITS